MNMDKRIAFILAGSSGSGKSTLLNKAFKQKIPVFGDELNELFQAVNPLGLPEKHSFQKALNEKTIFQAKHIPKLLALADQPRHLVFHLDILNVLVRLINHPVFMDDMPVGLKILQPREPEDLVDMETNKRMFRHYLSKSFKDFDLVLVNTLYTPYPKNVEQWQAKVLHNPNLDQEHPLFDVNNPRPDIYRAVYEAWIETVEEMNCHACYVSVLEKGVLELFQRTPDAENIRKFEIA